MSQSDIGTDPVSAVINDGTVELGEARRARSNRSWFDGRDVRGRRKPRLEIGLPLFTATAPTMTRTTETGSCFRRDP
jgi:hypothetical protein